MKDAVQEETRGDFKIKVYWDDSCEDPRKGAEPLGRMICFHRRYTLGDKHEETVESAEELYDDPETIGLPLFLYDHSGITMSTGPFSCPWDSGQVGFIMATKAEVLEWFGAKRMTKALRARAEDVLRAEVAEYDDFITGNCYGWTVTNADGDVIESVWGYLGDPEKSGCLEDARAVADSAQREDSEASKFVAL